MEKSFKLEILTPEREFFNDIVESMVVDTLEGKMGVIFGMIPMVSILVKGIINLKIKKKWIKVISDSGFIKIGKEKVKIFVNKCRWEYEPEVSEEEETKKEAEEREEQIKKLHEYRIAKVKLAQQLSKLKMPKD